MQVSATWPERGDIVFKSVSLRYDDNRDPVIKNINLHIPAGQKVIYHGSNRAYEAGRIGITFLPRLAFVAAQGVANLPSSCRSSECSTFQKATYLWME